MQPVWGAAMHQQEALCKWCVVWQSLPLTTNMMVLQVSWEVNWACQANLTSGLVYSRFVSHMLHALLTASAACCIMSYRAVEAAGLAPPGQGGKYIEQQYRQLLGPLEQHQQQQDRHTHGASSSSSRVSPVWPVNTHGGLLGFGAPWEVPAMISLVEAVSQLRGEAAGRQVPDARRALVYGNGGVFSASAAAILERQREGGVIAATCSKL